MDLTKNTPFVVIGLDFGTSSTKITFRWLDSDRPQALVLPNLGSDAGMHWFCTPTTAEFRDGRLQVGRGQPRDSGEYLKVQLLDSLGAESKQDSEVQLRALAYLAWVLEGATRAICVRLKVPSFRPIVNVGVPVAMHAKDAQATRTLATYTGLVATALASTSMMGGPGVEDGVDRDRLMEELRDAAKRCDKCVELVHALPESISAVVSYERDPNSEKGVFSVVDIGAGTTEVSVGWYSSDASGRSHVQCFWDSTERGGAVELMNAEESGGHDEVVRVLKLRTTQFERTWEHGRRKDCGSDGATGQIGPGWAVTKVWFTGGGGQDPRVAPAFRELESLDHKFQLGVYVPGAQVLMPASERFPRKDFFLLAVAHGLAYHQVSEWPEWYRPWQVKGAFERPDLGELPEYSSRGWV